MTLLVIIWFINSAKKNTQFISIISYCFSTYIALALASSRAVTQDWRSTSLAALMWNVWVPPLVMTNVHESTVWIKAPWSEIVPRQVCDISAWFLRQGNETKNQNWNQAQLIKCFSAKLKRCKDDWRVLCVWWFYVCKMKDYVYMKVIEFIILKKNYKNK